MSDEGDLLYSFPELMLTASAADAAALPSAATGSPTGFEEEGLRLSDGGSDDGSDDGDGVRMRAAATAKAAMVWEEALTLPLTLTLTLPLPLPLPLPLTLTRCGRRRPPAGCLSQAML